MHVEVAPKTEQQGLDFTNAKAKHIDICSKILVMSPQTERCKRWNNDKAP